jgi:predicted dehydrogenase
VKAAIVGCGLIGKKRAGAIPKDVELVGCFDISTDAANQFSQDFGCVVFSNMTEMLGSKNLDFIIVATRHDSLSTLTLECINANKHVLVEKPGAIRASDLREIAERATKKNLKLHIGFNHRYHPAVIRMFELIRHDAIGTPMYLRARYGHGGRLGYEKEWRANKAISGGGELIDQGSHLIDLSLRLFENLNLDYAYTPTYFWNMQVEDNAFLALKDKMGRMSFLHASCTEWKNLFSLEVYGRAGKLEISGLGSSYGLEKLTYYQMLPQMGPPLTKSWYFSSPDDSWKLELEEFISDIKADTQLSNNSSSSIRVLELIEEIYEKSGR